jgi:hypothetical protein
MQPTVCHDRSVADSVEELAQWERAELDRALNLQRSKADNAKLVATFVSAVVATVVATALQVGEKPTALDIAATILLIVTTWRAGSVVNSDGLRDVDRHQVQSILRSSGLTPETQLEQIRHLVLTTADGNDAILNLQMLPILRGQLIFAALSGLAAAVSLLWPGSPTLNW